MPTPEHHKNIQGGIARASVFGVSDGLVTNVSLILGVAGANNVSHYVRLAGLAGLIAGAFSMAAGEYISMKAQNELLCRELEKEKTELETHPEGEKKELAHIYESRGVSRELAEKVAAEMMKNSEVALEAHAREELGINPHELGKPMMAAISSFVSFAIGALIPLLPWLFYVGNGATIASIIISSAACVAVGSILSRFTGRNVYFSALRQVLVAGIAGAVTFGVGHFIGIGTSTT